MVHFPPAIFSNYFVRIFLGCAVFTALLTPLLPLRTATNMSWAHLSRRGHRQANFIITHKRLLPTWTRKFHVLWLYIMPAWHCASRAGYLRCSFLSSFANPGIWSMHPRSLFVYTRKTLMVFEHFLECGLGCNDQTGLIWLRNGTGGGLLCTVMNLRVP